MTLGLFAFITFVCYVYNRMSGGSRGTSFMLGIIGAICFTVVALIIILAIGLIIG